MASYMNPSASRLATAASCTAPLLIVIPFIRGIHTRHPPHFPSPARARHPPGNRVAAYLRKERRDFYEFVACNLFFATTSLIIALFRSRLMEARQARRLAARIGLVRGSGLDIR
ncbi:hypothetical protein EDD15DRAFT_2192376 [Pisolithus albus]|nr:hypothetical protein EDD15DRAFT_2192376 [Pisolithus albus]